MLSAKCLDYLWFLKLVKNMDIYLSPFEGARLLVCILCDIRGRHIVFYLKKKIKVPRKPMEKVRLCLSVLLTDSLDWKTYTYYTPSIYVCQIKDIQSQLFFVSFPTLFKLPTNKFYFLYSLKITGQHTF